ncbi:hypothetical protein [Pseudarthrobacter sp. S9]|uniref:hypothetical protein n=1 Tax=Pseudarthrobacter sp. S9 TaxID=3418421 RepID=UPI003D014375
MSARDLVHRMVKGYDFMPYEWCGGCETCDTMYCADVCLKCSYTCRGYPKDRPTYWCDKANGYPELRTALLHNGRKPR